MTHPYDAVLFDLLSALLDSWALWDDVAGDSTLGREWRMHYLHATSQTRDYQPYLTLIGKSANVLGITNAQVEMLSNRWGELTPWPEATPVVAEIAARTRTGVVTNCSEELGLAAANRIGIEFDVFLSAERAGSYKPDPRIYEKAIEEIGEPPERILYVAGSPFDVRGAAAAGMPVYWHNRIGLVDREANSRAMEVSDSLRGLLNLID